LSELFWLRWPDYLDLSMESRKLSILSRTTPVPTLSDPISNRIARRYHGTLPVYPGVFAYGYVVGGGLHLLLADRKRAQRDHISDAFKPDMILSSPAPDFSGEQAGIARVGGRATVHHSSQHGQAALPVPQQRAVHAG